MMGTLIRFPLSDEFVQHFSIFIETGYGIGRSLKYAAQHPFHSLYSIECWPEAVARGRADFQTDRRVLILSGDSAEKLPLLLERLPFHTPMFFWLDAHFPGGDCDDQPFDAESNMDIRLPLIKELDAIRAHRPDNSDFILIDDLRLYHDLDWGDGPPDEFVQAACRKERNLNFLWPFYETHCVHIDLHDSGYALIGPHNAPWLQFSE